MTEPKKLKLLPILDRLGACKEAKRWVKRRKFNTFSEAWDKCPNPEWIDWIVGQLAWALTPCRSEAVGLYKEADQVLYNLGDVEEDEIKKAIAEFYAPHCKKVEKWLFDYAHLYTCAVEVGE